MYHSGEKPRISIALCTYNGAKYLSQLLDSYLPQSLLPDEAVVCDDRSQDETLAILQEFASRAPFSMRILVNDRNLGSTKNFEKAISHCSGDIIFLSDQDDVWETRKIEKITGEFKRNPEVGMVFSDVDLVDEDLGSLGRTLYCEGLSYEERKIIEGGDLFSVLLKRDVVIGSAMAFRSNYRKAIFPIPDDMPDMIHDGWIAITVSAIAKSIFIDEPLVKYRQHEGQQTGVANYVPGVSRLKWRAAMEKGERNHKSKVDRLKAVKTFIDSQKDVPNRILKAMNEEIQYQRGYARHYRLRKELSDNHTKRLLPVVGELLSGRYHRFSNGFMSAARDLIVNHEQETEFHEIVDKRKNAVG